MNVELVPCMCGDYIDLNLFSNKHSASRLGRDKPPFAASRLHQLLIGLFSPADETSLTEHKAMSTRRIGEEGAEGSGKSHFWWYYILIISVNTGGRGSWANLSVDFSFHVWLWGVEVQPGVELSSWRSSSGHEGITLPTHTHTRTYPHTPLLSSC